MRTLIYASGNAGRTIKILSSKFNNTSLVIIIHDGDANQEIKSYCKENEIIYKHIDYEKEPNSKKSLLLSNTLLETAIKENIDFIFCFGTRILKGELLSLFKNRIINFHPSILPAFPGLNSIDGALEYGALLLGNSAHFITEEIDSGPVIMQSLYIANEFHSYDDVLDQQVLMYFQIVDWLKSSRIQILNGKVFVQNAKYMINSFIPNLEFSIE